MEELLNKFADDIASGIMSKRTRNSVKDELLDHLLLKYTDYIDSGYSEEEAFEKTTTEFGDINTIKNELAKQHPYYPRLSMNKATMLLLIGFLISSFKINLFNGMEQIWDAVGSLIMLTGLFCLSKNGGIINKAFKIKFGAAIFNTVTYAANIFYQGLNYIVGTTYFISVTLGLISWFYIINGLKELTDPFDKTNKIPYNTNKILYVICVFLPNLLAVTTAFTGENINIDSSIIALLFIAFMIITIIAGIKMFYNVHNVLNQNEHDYITEDSTNKKYKFSMSLVAFAIILTMLCNYLYISMPVKKLDFNKNDVELSKAVYEDITSKMLTYGNLDKKEIEDLINILPNSELIKLKTIIPFTNQPYNDLWSIEHSYIGNFSITYYTFILKHNEACVIQKYELTDKELNTRAAVKSDFSDNHIVLNNSSYLIYNKKTNEYYKAYTENRNNVLNELSSIEYHATLDTAVYFIKTIAIPSDSSIIGSKFKCAYYKLPMCGTTRNLKTELDNDSVISSNSIFIEAFGSWDRILLDNSTIDTDYDEDDDYYDDDNYDNQYIW